MREYAKISPNFWTGETGKDIKDLGKEARILAFYLMTSPHSNMLGLYHLPFEYIKTDTGLSVDEIHESFSLLGEINFCAYDFENEFAWVFEMGFHQVADKLSGKDKRIPHVKKLYSELGKNRFLGDFFDKYGACFCIQTPHRRDNFTKNRIRIPHRRGIEGVFNSEPTLRNRIDGVLNLEKASGYPIEGGSIDHRSKEKEQEKEKDKEQEKTIYVEQTRPDGVEAKVEELFAFWQEQHDHRKSTLDKKRRKAIKGVLAEGYKVERIKEAILGIKNSPHHMGDNDRKTVYDDIELICRSGTNVDRFAELNSRGFNGSNQNNSSKGGGRFAGVDEFVEEELQRIDEKRGGEFAGVRTGDQNTPDEYAPVEN